MHPRLILIALILAVLLVQIQEPVASPAQALTTRPQYELVRSAAPYGTVIYLELPGERLRDVPMVTVPGQPHRIGGGR